jgi:signal transduction histidine kinase
MARQREHTAAIIDAAATAEVAAPPRDTGATMTTLFARDGTVRLQNPAARAAFAGDDTEGGGLSPFVRHFLDPREGARLLRLAAAGESVRAEPLVHTLTGVAHHVVEVSPIVAPDGCESIVMLAEYVARGGDDAERMRDYAEAGADWFWEMDGALRLSAVTQSPHGFTPGPMIDALGQRLAELPMAGEEATDWRPLMHRLEARRPFRDFRFHRRSAQGELRHLLLSGVPVFDAGGTFRGYRGIGRDLTNLVQAEELAEKTALLHATLDNMEQGLLVLDAALRVKLWNDRLLELLGGRPEEIWLGRPAAELVRITALRGDYGAGDPEETIARHLEQFNRGGPSVAERVLANGRTFEVRTSAMPKGGILITYLDISERKNVEVDLRRAKEEAELASRSKTEFLANMSHELRTPLNAIIGFSDILAGATFGPLGDPRYGGYVRDIRDSGLHLLNLINDVLDVSKVEFGKVELLEETVDPQTVIDACMRLMRDRADAAGVRLVQPPPGPLPTLQADSRRLKQILLNLLSNAVKFTPPGGRVTLSVRADGTGLRVMIEDTGIGIDPADLDKALRPFGQIDSRLARKYQGSGLGLPLTKSMTELHGGRLQLASTPGRGTTATVWLPPERLRWPALP